MFFNSDNNRDESPLARYWQEQRRGREGQTYVPDGMGRLGQGRWISQSEQADTVDFGGSAHNLDGSVGWNGANARSDVAKVETLLGQSGHLDLGKTDGPTGYFGIRLEDAVKSYQKDSSLKVDGHLNPKGETIGALKNVDVNKEKAGNQMSFWKSPGKRTIKWTKGLKFQVPKIKMKLRVMNGLGGLSREKIRFDLAAIDAKW